MEEKPERNSDFNRPNVFTAGNPYLLLLFGLSCLVGSILIQVIFIVLGKNILGINVSALAGIVFPIFLLLRLFPAGFRIQARLHSPDIHLLFRVVLLSLAVIVVIDYVYLLTQHFLPAPKGYLENMLQLKPKSPGMFVLAFIGICIIVPFAEELLFRGFIQQILELNMNATLAFLLAGIFFGAAHLEAFLLISITLFGILLGYVFYTTRNLTYAITMHAVFNTASFLQLVFTPEDKLSQPPFYTQHLWMLTIALVVLAWLLIGIKKGAAESEAPWDRE